MAGYVIVENKAACINIYGISMITCNIWKSFVKPFIVLNLISNFGVAKILCSRNEFGMYL